MKREAYTIWQNLWNSRITCCSLKKGSYVPKHESRTPLYKVEIHGVTEATFYKYNKDGTLNSVPQQNITCDAHSSFYTMFNPEIDFAKVFETHTPLKIEYQDA